MHRTSQRAPQRNAARTATQRNAARRTAAHPRLRYISQRKLAGHFLAYIDRFSEYTDDVYCDLLPRLASKAPSQLVSHAIRQRGPENHTKRLAAYSPIPPLQVEFAQSYG